MIVIDTGPLVAAANERDNHHERCLDYLETAPGPLIVPAPVVVEVCYFLESRRGHHASATFLHQLVDGTLTYTELTAAELQRMEHLVGQYTDLPLSAVDASVIAVAERLKVADIATLDHRDFRVVKPAHIPAFTLRP